MNELGRPPLGIRLTLVLLVAVVLMGAGSGTFARMSLPQPAWVEPPVTFTPTERFSCDGAQPGWPRGSGVGAGCESIAVPPRGAQAARWTLDPHWQFYTDATELHVLVNPVGVCPGSSAYSQVVAQHVEERPEVVAVSLVIVDPLAPANATETTDTIIPDAICLGGGSWRPLDYILKLPAPVGDRVLVDGGVDPPTVIRVP